MEEQARLELSKKMQELAGKHNPVELAKLVGSPFDPENPVSSIIEAVFKTDSVGRGEDYEYFVADEDVKKVTAVVSGAITQTNVVPLTTSDLSFSTYTSDEYYVYLEALLAGKHDMLAKKRIAITESLNRIENYLAIGCIDGAVETAKEFTLDSGKEKFDYPKLIEMIRAIARYAQGNLVLISGANVTTDIVLMDYDADKNRELTLAKAGVSKWIPVEEQSVTIASTPTAVIDPDVAYLVAPSFTPDRESAHFVRREVRDLDGAGDKERITIGRGPIIPVGATAKWAYAVAGMEQFGCVFTNPKVIAKFTRN